jgi:hypothetical protein
MNNPPRFRHLLKIFQNQIMCSDYMEKSWLVVFNGKFQLLLKGFNLDLNIWGSLAPIQSNFTNSLEEIKGIFKFCQPIRRFFLDEPGMQTKSKAAVRQNIYNILVILYVLFGRIYSGRNGNNPRQSGFLCQIQFICKIIEKRWIENVAMSIKHIILVNCQNAISTVREKIIFFGLNNIIVFQT